VDVHLVKNVLSRIELCRAYCSATTIEVDLIVFAET